MKTIIYYFSGTGNSFWTARSLAERIENTTIRDMSEQGAIQTQGADAVGFVFPVHIWGLPNFVIRFLDKMKFNPDVYYFAIAVNGGQVSRTLIQLKKYLKIKGVALSSGFDIKLPSNYIPWGGPGPAEKLEKLYKAAKEKIDHVAPLIAGKKTIPVEKGPLWQRIIFTALYKMSFNQIHGMDKNFWTDEKCNGCGICKKVCPVNNIEIKENKPVWLHHCEQCLACIQWCPRKALQFGKKTPVYERYHHPEVKLNDLIKKVI